jgi:glycine dehydrogenase subunit 1
MKYVPHTAQDYSAMLAGLGLNAIDELFTDIPEGLRLRRPLNLPSGKTEMEVRAAMEAIADKNVRFRSCFRGAGSYRHHIPAAVGHVLSRSEFYTAYTPYQPETSQGILQAIFEYQTMVCELTGMNAANASVYDGATAAFEAVAMCIDANKRKAVLCGAVNPQTAGVLNTWCNSAGVELVTVVENGGKADITALEVAVDGGTACVIVQQPNFFGLLEDVPAIERITHAKGAKLVLSCNPISLGLLKPPGEWGADIAIGEGQPLGNPMNFGGPYLGFMACREAMQRKLPGRIVGETVDHDGNRGYVLTLQAREQHIRREKASSNICSNEALNALAAAVYLSAVGPEGLKEASTLCAERAHYAADEICKLPGMKRKHKGQFFNEFVIESNTSPEMIEKALAGKGILSGLPLGFLGEGYKNCMLYCCTEMNTEQEIDTLVAALREVAGK